MMLDLVYSANPRMVFKKQSKHLNLTDGDYQIQKDMAELRNTNELSYVEYCQLITKMINRVRINDSSYFYSKELLLDFAQNLSAYAEIDNSFIDNLIKVSDDLPKLINPIDVEKYRSDFINDDLSIGNDTSRLVDHIVLDYNISTHEPNTGKLYELLEEGKIDTIDEMIFRRVFMGIMELYQTSGDTFKKYKDAMYIIIEKHPKLARKVLAEILHEKTNSSEKIIIKEMYVHCISREKRDSRFSYLKTE